jgi:hypothetical protein
MRFWLGNPYSLATVTLPVPFPKVLSGGRQPLSESMDGGIQEIVIQGWSVALAAA